MFKSTMAGHVFDVCYKTIKWTPLPCFLNWHQYKSLATLIVARGDSTGSFHSAMKTLEKKVKNAYSCIPWNPYPIDVWTGIFCRLSVVSVVNIVIYAF